MANYAIVTDLNRCVGCLACSVACKALNGVQPGEFWNKTLRIGPNPTEDGRGQYPDVEMYFLTAQCQHCENPECTKVCPTGASQKMADGTVQIDKEKCIGCQFCVMSCPYGVRYLNEDERVVEKCTLCTQTITQGGLPACVAQCGGMARFFGDLDKGIGSFEGPERADGERIILKDFVEEFIADDVHQLPDVGNHPSFQYILRDRKWQGAE